MVDCTKEQPWNKDPRNVPVRHVDAQEVGEQRDGWPSGDVVTMRCPNCGHQWEKELPQ